LPRAGHGLVEGRRRQLCDRQSGGPCWADESRPRRSDTSVSPGRPSTLAASAERPGAVSARMTDVFVPDQGRRPGCGSGRSARKARASSAGGCLVPPARRESSSLRPAIATSRETSKPAIFAVVNSREDGSECIFLEGVLHFFPARSPAGHHANGKPGGAKILPQRLPPAP